MNVGSALVLMGASSLSDRSTQHSKKHGGEGGIRTPDTR